MRAIVFDIDGTLIESMAVDSELYFAAITAVLGPVRIRERLTDYEHVTDNGILAQIVEDNDLVVDDSVLLTVQSRFVASIEDHLERFGPFREIDGALRFFDELRHAEHTFLAIATGGWRRSALLKLQSAGFEIDGIPVATCDDSPTRIGIMRAAIARFGDAIDSVTYFGDAEWDRLACRSLGWKFVPVGPDVGGIESYAGLRA